MTPACLGDASADAAAMNTTTDPNSSGSASLPTSLTGELQRLRYVLDHVTGWTQWWTHYEDINFADRMIRNHLGAQLAGNTRSLYRGQMGGLGATTRFHMLSFGFENLGVHHETALLHLHVNAITQFLVDLGGNVHASSLTLRSAGTASHAAIFLRGHQGSGLFWPDGPNALAWALNGSERLRLHAAGLMASVDGSSDIGTAAGSRFRHIHITGSLTAASIVGSVTLSTPNVDTLTVSGAVNPAGNTTADLGTTALQWRSVHAVALTVHALGLFAPTNNSFDIGDGSGSRFRHVHVSGAIVTNTGTNTLTIAQSALLTVFEVQIRNNGGTIEHRIVADDAYGAASSFISRVVGASTTWVNTPTLSAGVDFNTGVGIGGGSSSIIIFNAGHLAGTSGFRGILPGIVTLEYNSTGNHLSAALNWTTTNANGTTRDRPGIYVRDAATGVDRALNTTTISAGEALRFRYFGFMQ